MPRVACVLEFIEIMERLYCPMPIRSRLENYFLQEKYHHDPNFELVADILDWMMHRYDLKKSPSFSPDDHKNYNATSGTENEQEMMVKRRIPINSESDRIQFVKQAVLFFHEKEHIQLDPKAIYAADDTSLKELAKIAEILMDAVNVETEYRTSKMEKSQGKEGEEELQILLQEQHQQQDEKEEAKDTLIMTSSLPSESLLADDLKSLTSLGKTLTESAARLHELLQKHSEHQKEISNLSTLYNNVGSNHGTNSSQQEQGGGGGKGPPQLLLDTMTTIESFIKEEIKSIQQEVFSLEEELAHLKADENDLLFDLNNKNEELERNTIRLRNLQHTRPSFMDEQETLQKELQKHYELYMERFRNIHYLHHELKLVEKEEQTLQDKLQKRTMDRQARLREEEQQISAEMMFTNPHDRQSFKKHSKKDDLASSHQPAKTKQNLDFDTKDHHPPKETNHHEDNIHDSSSASGSSALIISQCSNEEQLSNHSDKSMESSFSRTTSISVDSSTYFMTGPDLKSFVSPTSKSSLSGDESDDNF